MLRQSLLALAHRDLTQARARPERDDEVDRLYQEAHQALVVLLKTDPQVAGQATALSRVAHNLERTADRVINICEWVIFAIIGEVTGSKVAGGMNPVYYLLVGHHNIVENVVL
jgi:phosphate transport system protein